MPRAGGIPRREDAGADLLADVREAELLAEGELGSTDPAALEMASLVAQPDRGPSA